MTKSAKIGVLLANLGTPDSPTPKSISRYLWQFLTDPRVVDLPRCKWYPLLKAIILPLRSKRIAKIIKQSGQNKVRLYLPFHDNKRRITSLFRYAKYQCSSRNCHDVRQSINTKCGEELA